MPAPQRDLPLPFGRRHEHARERFGVGPEIAHVADVHGIPLAPFDRGGRVRDGISGVPQGD